MTRLRELKLSLLDWETRYVLESLARETERLRVIAEQSEDTDEAADAGNDYIEVSGLKERLENEAEAVFGEQIKNFSNERL